MAKQALLAIDPPRSFAGRVPVPCLILDPALRPITTVIADGAFKAVPAGTIIVTFPSPDDSHFRRVLRLDDGGRYRLHYFSHRSLQDADSTVLGPNVDEFSARIVVYLQAGYLSEASHLIQPQLAKLREGDLSDPIVASAVGYVLLHTWDLEFLSPWCFELVHANRDFPDALIVAGEYHALVGNHLAAIDHLRQLPHLDLPVFGIGLSRALQRLAGYAGMSLSPADSSYDHAREEPERPEPNAGLNQWNLDEAAASFEVLASLFHVMAVDGAGCCWGGGTWSSLGRRAA